MWSEYCEEYEVKKIGAREKQTVIEDQEDEKEEEEEENHDKIEEEKCGTPEKDGRTCRRKRKTQ